jgi:competence protein ComEC
MFRRPLFLPLGAWIAGVLLAGFGSGALYASLLLVAVGGVAVALAGTRKQTLVALASLIAGLAILRTLAAARPSRFDLSSLPSRVARPASHASPLSAEPDLNLTVIGRLLEDPRPYDNRLAFAVEVEGALVHREPAPADGRVLVNLYLDRHPVEDFPALTYGERIRVQGRLRLPSPAYNPGEFDYRAYLARQGIHSLLAVNGPGNVAVLTPATFSWRGLCLAVKRRMEASLRAAVPSADAEFMAALLFSEQSLLPQQVKDDFVATGTVHLLSTSGIHVAAIAIFLHTLLGPYRRRYRRPLALLLIAFLIAFGVMAGMRPAVERAVLMAALVYGAELFDHEADGPNLLCLAALILLICNPLQLYDVGFQFSFTAVAGIMLLAPSFDPLIRRLLKADLPSWKTTLATLLAASVAVEIFLTPLIAYDYQRISLVSIAANLVVIPLSSPLIPFGLIQAALGILSLPSATFTGYATSGLLWIFKTVVHGFAILPFAQVSVFRPSLGSLLIYYLLLVGYAQPWLLKIQPEQPLRFPFPPPWLRRGIMRHSSYVFPVSFGFCLLAGGLWLKGWPFAPFLSSPSGLLRFTFINVGQGDCLLVETPDGARMLVDGGGVPADPSQPAPFDVGERVVVPYLRRIGVDRLDVVVLTHPHDDHVGGLGAVLEEIPTRLVLEGGQPSDSPPYRRFARDIAQCRIPDRAVATGDSFSLGREIQIDVLGPQPPSFVGTHSDFNNNSVVLRLKYRSFSALLTGDIEAEAEARLMPRFEKTDLLKVAHHGSRFSTSDAFVERVRPEIAVISVGEYNHFGHPNLDVIHRLEANGTRVYRTDRDGQVTVETDGQRMWTRSFLHPSGAISKITPIPVMSAR